MRRSLVSLCSATAASSSSAAGHHHRHRASPANSTYDSTQQQTSTFSPSYLYNYYAYSPKRQQHVGVSSSGQQMVQPPPLTPEQVQEVRHEVDRMYISNPDAAPIRFRIGFLCCIVTVIMMVCDTMDNHVAESVRYQLLTKKHDNTKKDVKKPQQK